jgi:photosystem II stability/assembly factor-like uncharacterized protein
MKYTFLIILSFLIFQLNSQSWTTISSGTTNILNSVAFASNDIVFAVGNSGSSYRSSDGGLTWQTSSLPTNNSYYDVKFLDASTGFIVASFGRIFKTTDGGLSWVQKNSGSSDDLKSISISNDGQTIYATGGLFEPIISKSTNQGENWSLLAAPYGGSVLPNAIDFHNENTGYLVGDGNVLYKTTNGGVSWSQQTHPYGGNINAFFALNVLDENNVFACGGNQRIMKTTNGGTTWTNINSTQTSGYRGLFFKNVNEGHVVGADGKILFTSNGGSSYVSEVSGTTSTLNSIVFNSLGVGIIVGHNGIILRKEAPAANTPPIAQDDASTTAFNTPVTTNVLANDSDPGGALNPASVTVTVPSPNGTTSVNTTTGAITFTPTAGFVGTTTYTYQVCDNGSPALCATATVTITVNAAVNNPPVAQNDASTTAFETPVTTNVLANDSDPDGDILTVSIVSQSANGNCSCEW